MSPKICYFCCTIADLYFDFSWLPKARRVVSSGIVASPSVIICLEFQPFLRRTLDRIQTNYFGHYSKMDCNILKLFEWIAVQVSEHITQFFESKIKQKCMPSFKAYSYSFVTGHSNYDSKSPLLISIKN